MPLARWATRFDSGVIELAGRLLEPCPLVEGDPAATVPAGVVRIWLSFAGGVNPHVPEIRIEGGGVCWHVVGGVDALGVTVSAPLDTVAAVLDRLHDATMHVQAHPAEDLIIKVGPGLSATIPKGGKITLEAASVGPPDQPRLNRPLVASIGGAGVSVRLPGSRWLRLLATVSIRRASLAPDGEVELQGNPVTSGLGQGTFDRAVGAGLRHASHQLSNLVRWSPQFARIRAFLSSDYGES